MNADPSDLKHDDAKIIEDHVYIWEKFAKKALMTLPHARIENIAILAFSGRSCQTEYFKSILSFAMVMSIVWVVENFHVLLSKTKQVLFGANHENASRKYNSQPDEMELSDSILSHDDNDLYPK